MLCKDAQKPLALLTLLARRLAGQQTLVFAASVETAHRCGVDNSCMWTAMQLSLCSEVPMQRSHTPWQLAGMIASIIKRKLMAIRRTGSSMISLFLTGVIAFELQGVHIPERNRCTGWPLCGVLQHRQPSRACGTSGSIPQLAECR